MTLNCLKCGAPVDKTEIGLTKKLLGKASEKFLCLDCLSKHFSVSKELLKEKAEQFKQSGCSLFD